jgi:outer membrane protein assembly factor BamB
MASDQTEVIIKVRMRIKSFLVVAAILSVVLPLRAQNWPSFRGQHASGVADGKPVPAIWNIQRNINIAWKVPVPGLAHSSPVVWGDKVFITTAVSGASKSDFRPGFYINGDTAEDMSKHTWKVYCLNKKTGQIMWERVSYEGIPRTKRHIKASFANSTPATDGNYLVVLFGSEGLFCYDLKGNLNWKRDLGALGTGWRIDPDSQWGAASSPIIYKGLAIVQCDTQKGSFISAYSLKDGNQVWQTLREESSSWGSPTIVEGRNRVELVTNATNAVRGYNPLTGKELWKLASNTEFTSTTPVAAHDLIFICNGYRDNPRIYAIKQGSATGDISLKGGATANESVAWSLKRGGSWMPTPVIYSGLLYVCDDHGILTVYRAKTGELIYKQRLGAEGGAYSASPITADGKIYFSSEDGDIFVVKAGPKYELLAVNPMDEVLMATPAISDGMIIVRGQKHLFGIAENSANNSKIGR